MLHKNLRALTQYSFSNFWSENDFTITDMCYIGRYTNMAMVEMGIECCYHTYIEHRNLEIRKHVTTSCSGTKPFYYFRVKGFDIRRRDTIFLCWLLHLPLSRAAPMACKFVSHQRVQMLNLLVRRLDSTLT